MELANIEKLVEKYLNADTSLQEEVILKNYFTKEEIPPHLQEYTSMFSYFATAKDETYTKTIQLETRKPKKGKLKWIAVAASIALLISVFIGKKVQEKREIEEQYAQVTKALNLLSTNLKKGEKAVATLYTYENTVLKILK